MTFSYAQSAVFIEAFSDATSMFATPKEYVVKVISYVDLGTLGEQHTVAFSINNNSQIAGMTHKAPYNHPAFLWENNLMTNLGYLTNIKGVEGYDINIHKKIVGRAAVKATSHWGGIKHAFLWENGVMTDLGTLSGDSSLAFNINDSDQIVGWSEIATDIRHAFLWENDVMTDLGTLEGGVNSTASAINNSGQIIGWSELAEDNVTHAILWENGVMTDLGTFGGVSSAASSINNSGQIVGWYEISGIKRIFSWKSGVMTDLGTLKGYSTSPSSNNNLGQVVGTAIVDTKYHPFFYENGKIADLYEIIANKSMLNVQDIALTDINDKGEMVGYIKTTDNKEHAFLLTINTPPVAYTETVRIKSNQIQTGQLKASDINSDTLAYTIISYPEKGVVNIINMATGNYTYTPYYNQSGMDSFQFKVNDGFNDSNIATVSIFITAVHNSPQEYVVKEISYVDLGTLGEQHTLAFSINNNSQIAGVTHKVPYNHPAFLWENNMMTNLGYLTNIKSAEGYDINIHKKIVGRSAVKATSNWRGIQHAFLWENGVMTDLGTLSGDSSLAFNINDSDQIVGWSEIATDIRHAFLWENGVMTDLGTLEGGVNSTASAINNSGQIIGWSELAEDNVTHAILWENGVMTDLGTFGGVSSAASSINNSGQIVGWYEISGIKRIFSWKSGVMTDLGTLKGYSTSPSSNNNLGQVVGTAIVDTKYHPFFYENGKIADLYEIIANKSMLNVQDIALTDINDKGEMVGYIKTTDNKEHAFLLTINTPPVAYTETVRIKSNQIQTGQLKASDINSDTLAYTIISYPEKGVVNIINMATGNYTYTPYYNQSGMDSFQFKVNDGFNDSNIATVSIFITAVHNLPSISEIESHETSEDIAVRIPFTITATGDISVTLTSSDQKLIPDKDLMYISDGEFYTMVATPAMDAFGKATITVTVSEGKAVTTSFHLSVFPVNDPPEIANIPNQTIAQNTNFDSLKLDNYITDIDNLPQEMTWNVTGQINLDVSIMNRIAAISIKDSNWYGTETLTFIATDPGGLTAECAVTFIITQSNDLQPPQNLEASTTNNGVLLKWKPLSDFSINYSVYRSQTENGIYYPIHSEPVNAYDMLTNGFIDINIQADNSYFYRVKSCKGEFESDFFSNTAKITVTDNSDFKIKCLDNAHQILQKGGAVTYDLIINKEATFRGQLSIWCINIPQNIQYQISVNGSEMGTRADQITLLPTTISIQMLSRSSAITGNYQFELQCVNFDGTDGNYQKSLVLGLTIVSDSGICIDVNQSIIHYGQNNKISGSIYPPLKSKAVQLTAFSNQQIYLTQEVLTQAGGVFTDESWIAGFAPGIYTIQASWQDTSYMKQTAKSQPIVIQKQLPVMTCTPGQDKPTIDQDFSIMGKLSPDFSFETVLLKIFSPDSSNDQTIEVYTDGKGYFRKSQPFFNQNGLWAFKAYFMGNESAIGCESDPYELLVGNNASVIIVGGGEASIQNTYWDVTKKLVTEAYKDFKRMGYSDEMIHLMINSKMIDINNDDIPDNVVDTSIPTAKALINVIQNEYADILNENDTLYIYMQGHGTSNSKFKILGNDEYISSAQLKKALDIFQHKTNSQVVVILESCYSGLFVKDLSNDNRIIIASAGDEPYNTDSSGRISLSRYFFSRICQGDSIEKAFKYAYHQLENKNYPVPLLDDNGDGIGNGDGIINMLDGLLASRANIPGIKIWGRPEISGIDLIPVLDNQTTLEVKLRVESRAEEIQKVWAQVIPSDAAISSGTQTISFPETELFYNQSNVYKGSIPHFSYDGSYTVLFYAENMDNDISDPEQVIVRVTNVGKKKDFDGDNRTSLKDLIIVLQSLSGMNALPGVGMSDAIYLIQYLNGVFCGRTR
jgi:probable HAF family extracellular repeat protein